MRALALIVAVAFIAGCQASASQGPSTSAGSSGVGAAASPSAAPAGKVYRIGQQIVAGPFEFTVAEAKQIASLGSFTGQYKPAAGNVFFEARISMESSAAGDYSELDFTVEDASGRSYANNQKNSQALGSGSLPVGRLVSGWVSFEVPVGVAGRMTLVYTAPTASPIRIRLF
jgi:hypothetical protein